MRYFIYINQDEIQAGMKDANKNEVIFSGLEFKTFILNLRELFQCKLVLERRFKGISAIRFGSEYNY